MSIKKSIQKMLQNPTEMRYKEVKGVLEYFGYRFSRITGSHHIFEDHRGDLIVFPVHHNKVTKYYLKYIKSVIIPT